MIMGRSYYHSIEPVTIAFAFVLCSFQGSPGEERNFRSDGDEAEMEEATSSGQEDSSDHNDILEWAKVLNITCFYTFTSISKLSCVLFLLCLWSILWKSHYFNSFLIFQANNYGSLQVICEYYRLRCPARGTTLTFQPLDHLHPIEFHRPGETTLHIAGSTIDLRLCSTSLELAEVGCKW